MGCKAAGLMNCYLMLTLVISEDKGIGRVLVIGQRFGILWLENGWQQAYDMRDISNAEAYQSMLP